MKLRALRSAITVDANESEAILSATEELVREVMERNALAVEDMVSCIFTCTRDLDAEFPAVAARNLGLSSVPLLCAHEIDVPGALPRVVRLLPTATRIRRPSRSTCTSATRSRCDAISRGPSDGLEFNDRVGAIPVSGRLHIRLRRRYW